jgi:bla regulator protein blaR1
MIIAWMMYATLLTVLVAVAAIAAERSVAVWRGGRRLVWLAALGAATVVPVLLATRAVWTRVRIVRPDVRWTAVERPEAAHNDVPPATTISKLSLLRAIVAIRADHAMTAVDPYALTVWLPVSGALLLLYLGALVGVRLRQRRWRESAIDGEPVLLARDVGPAVVGMFAPRVVVPDWMLTLDRRSRILVLRHENEHICAGDPQLLAFATLLVILFPWNPALWFIVNRIRLAVEVDCDSRVLLGADDTGEYGALLLKVCAHRTTTMALAPALAEHTAHIERRIIAMTAQRPRRPLAVSIAFASLALVVVAIACAMPRPVELSTVTLGLSKELLTQPIVVVTGQQSRTP